MSDEFYVKLTGRLQEGRAPDLAAQFLSDTFHIPLETGRTYFNGSSTVLKKKLDRETAEKVCHRLRNAGAECELEEVPDLGFTLELVEDVAHEAPEPEPIAPEPAVQAEDDFSLQLVDVDSAAEPKQQPIALETLEQAVASEVEDVQVQNLSAQADMGLERVEQSEPAAMELELHPSDAPAPALEAQSLSDGVVQRAPPPPPPLAAEQTDPIDKSEEVSIGDVTADASSGGGVGGMLPQASTAPSFKRPGQFAEEEPSGTVGKKMLLPIGGGVLLLCLGVAYWLLFAESAPPPAVAQQQVQVKPKPVKVDNSMFIALQMDELQIKFDSLLGSIATWREQFPSSAAMGGNAEQLKHSLKTDMGVSEADWQDPWGSSIEMHLSEVGVRLISAGPDKQMGSEDDVVKEQMK